MRRVLVFLTVLFLLSGLGVTAANASPPGIPSKSVARARLAVLTVRAESHQATYRRSLFPLWIKISGACNTRETVLKRDGRGVTVNATCTATSGSWKSPYDGATWRKASDIDIDHMVPLSEAWKSGAWALTTSKRRAFANDLVNPQLWGITDNVNQAKGDKDPAAWRPSRTGFWCTYAKAWITVKHRWKLTVQRAEKTALAGMLNRC